MSSSSRGSHTVCAWITHEFCLLSEPLEAKLVAGAPWRYVCLMNAGGLEHTDLGTSSVKLIWSSFTRFVFQWRYCSEEEKTAKIEKLTCDRSVITTAIIFNFIHSVASFLSSLRFSKAFFCVIFSWIPPLLYPCTLSRGRCVRLSPASFRKSCDAWSIMPPSHGWVDSV